MKKTRTKIQIRVYRIAGVLGIILGISMLFAKDNLGLLPLFIGTIMLFWKYKR